MAIACAFLAKREGKASPWLALCAFSAFLALSEFLKTLAVAFPSIDKAGTPSGLTAVLAGLAALEFARRELKKEGLFKGSPWLLLPALAFGLAGLHFRGDASLSLGGPAWLLLPASLAAAGALFMKGKAKGSWTLKTAALLLAGQGLAGTAATFHCCPAVYMEAAFALGAGAALWRRYEKISATQGLLPPPRFSPPLLACALALAFIAGYGATEWAGLHAKEKIDKDFLEDASFMAKILPAELAGGLPKTKEKLSKKLEELQKSHLEARLARIAGFEGLRPKALAVSDEKAPGAFDYPKEAGSFVIAIDCGKPAIAGPWKTGGGARLMSVMAPLESNGGAKMSLELLIDANTYMSGVNNARLLPIMSVLALALVALAFFVAGWLNYESQSAIAAAERAKDLALWGAEVGTWTTNYRNGKTVISKRGLEMLGYECEGKNAEWDNAKCLDMIAPEDRDALEASFVKHAEGRAPIFEAEHRMRRKDGSWQWVMARGKITERAENGTPLEAAGTLTDVNALKETEQRLRSSMIRLETAQRLAGLGAWERDLATGNVSLSKEAKAILGLPLESEPSLKEILALTHPDDQERVWKAQAKCVEDEAELNIAYKVLRQDGSVIFIHSMGQVSRDEAGRPVRLEGSIMDISSVKRTEEALLRSEAAFRSLIENQSDLVIRLSKDFKMLYVSPTISKFRDIKAEACVGLPLSAITPPGAEHTGFRDACLKSVMESGKPMEKEISIASLQGERLFNWRIFPEFNASGELISVLCIYRDITEHREAELAFKNIFDNMLDGFFIGEMLEGWSGGEADFRITAVNPSFERMTGLAADKLINRRLSTFATESDKPLLKKLAEVLESGHPAHVSEFNAVNGKVLEISAYKAAVGKIACIAADITERKRAVQELSSQMRLMQTVFDGIPDIVLLLRPDRSIIACNRAASSLMGWSQESLAGCCCHSLLGLGAPCESCAAEESARSFSPSMKTVESLETGRSYEIRSMPLLDEKEGGVRMIVELIRDNTEKNTMERDLDKVIDNLQAEILQRMSAEEALRRSEKLHRMLTEAVQVGIWQLDHEGRILYCNPRMREILELESDEDLADKSSFDFVPESRIKPMEEAKDGEESFIHSYESEAHGLKGAKRNVLISGIILYAPGTKTLDTYIETFTDITEIRRAEREGESRKLKLMQAEKMAALGVLVSGVAHEINNPTNFIMLNAPILLDVWKSALRVLDRQAEAGEEIALAGLPYGEMRPLVPELFKSVFDGAERIKNIVAGLKEYARQDVSDSLATTNVNDAVQTSLVLLSNMIKRSTHRFKASYGDDLPDIKGAKQKVEQVILNLVQNSCQALKDMDKSLEIRTSFSDGKVKITVIDQGCGIPKENMPFITDPFFTTKRDAGGTGLGLSITAGIVNELGGEIVFESEQDRGTTATVSFPPCQNEELLDAQA